MPEPCSFVVTPGSNKLGAIAGSMPAPRSDTVKCAWPARSSASIWISF
jgi:hypothetical protein